MKHKSLEKVIELIIRVPPIIYRKLHREVFKTLADQLDIDIAPHHLLIMKLLQESNGLHSSEIAEAMVIAKSQMTHSIDKLINLGMVERKYEPEDRRKIKIILTKKGRHFIGKFDEIVRARMKTKLSVISGDELEKLSEAFQYASEVLAKL